MKRHNCSFLACCMLCIRRDSAGPESVGSSGLFSHSLELICADPKLVLAVTDTGPTCQPCRFLLLDLQSGRQQAAKSNALFMLDTGSFIDARRRLMKAPRRGTKAGFTSGAFVSLSPTCKVFYCTFFYSFLHNLLCYPRVTFSPVLWPFVLFYLHPFFNCRTIKMCIGNVNI